MRCYSYGVTVNQLTHLSCEVLGTLRCCFALRTVTLLVEKGIDAVSKTRSYASQVSLKLIADLRIT